MNFITYKLMARLNLYSHLLLPLTQRTSISSTNIHEYLFCIFKVKDSILNTAIPPKLFNYIFLI